MKSGGYESGYRACPCFWGTEPGSLVKELSSFLGGEFASLRVLDVGCGEGKNAIFFASRGAVVRAIDVSEKAISNGQAAFGCPMGLRWEVGDIRQMPLGTEEFDIVVAYGSLHCFATEEEVTNTLERLKTNTVIGGFHVICAFNDRDQDLSAHPDFTPLLLKHEEYLSFYAGWQLLHTSDSDLVENHPHNLIVHHHSMTRIIARKLA
jgi:SAM-dependent methyltransferase